MIRGELRKQIFDDCPEEFEDELKNWIDELESKLNDILGLLEIKELSDLDKIEDAKNSLEDICDGLY